MARINKQDLNLRRDIVLLAPVLESPAESDIIFWYEVPLVVLANRGARRNIDTRLGCDRRNEQGVDAAREQRGCDPGERARDSIGDGRQNADAKGDPQSTLLDTGAACAMLKRRGTMRKPVANGPTH